MNLFLLLAAYSVIATEPADTTAGPAPAELQEVVVEGATRHTAPGKSVYTPLKSQTDAASSPGDLLRRIGITSLDIDPSGESIKTNTGQDVALFIDMQPATQADVQGLRMQDVRKVEVLDFPSDPRFMGKQHVVNFVMVKYKAGGYTRLSAREFFFTNSGNGSVFSKLASGRMTFDLYAGADYGNSRHYGSSVSETYRFADGETVVRNSDPLASHLKTDGQSYSLRARYATDNVSVSNQLSFGRNHTSDDYEKGRLSFDPPIFGASVSESRSRGYDISPSYRGDFFFNLGKGYSLNADATFAYTRTKSLSSYLAENVADIRNNALDDSYYWRVNLRAGKTFGGKHTLSLEANGSTNHDKVMYSGGSDATDRFMLAFWGVGAAYSASIGKVYLSADAGAAFEYNRINGRQINDAYPYVHLYSSWSPGAKGSLGVWFQFASNSPGASSKSPNMLRQNELLWIEGNPGVKNARHITFNLNYTWMPCDAFSATAYAEYFGIYKQMIAEYRPDGPDGAMLRRWVNDGDYQTMRFGASMKLSLLKRKLQISARPQVELYKITGFYRRSIAPFSLSASAFYYVGGFNFGASWWMRSRSMGMTDGSVRTSRSYLQISAGWGNADWNVSLILSNPFRNHYRAQTSEMAGPWFDSCRTVYRPECSRMVMASVSYTIGYGKKVSRDNEVGQGASAGNAILK